MAKSGESSENVQKQQGQDTAGSSNVNDPQQERDTPPAPPQVPEGGDDSTKAAEQGVGSGSGSGAGEEARTEGQQEVPVAVVEGKERKRGRKDEAGASGSGEKKQRKKGELLEVPNRPPQCYVCGRGFQSWKAVFGHMRAHKVGEERARSGAFPPPVFTPPGGNSPQREQQVAALQEKLVPTLLNIAQEVLSRPQEGSGSASARGLDIDLNQALESAASPVPPSSPEKQSFDLNEPPSKEEDDNNGDNSGAGGGAAA